jgi:ATP-dependent helicase/nuclease subunit A
MIFPVLRQTLAHDTDTSQRAASNPEISAWVNASAGSGKTKVLTDRVTRLLLAGSRPEKILCLTYTRAGAAEMANRITERLKKWAVCDDDALRLDLDKLQDEAPTSHQLVEARRLFARVLSCPGGLRIRTIHSFCQEILSRFPIEAGLPPYFALIEEQELDVLANETLDDLLREANKHPHGKLARALNVLVAAQGEAGFAAMLQEILRARGRLEKTGALEKLAAKTRGFLGLGPDDRAEKFRRETISRAPEADLRQMAKWLADGSSRYSVRGEAIALFLRLSLPERMAKFDDYLGFFLTEKGEPFAPSFVASKKIREVHPDIDEICAHEALRLRSALERIEAAEITETTESVLSFGLAFAKRLSERKAARAVLDYNDLILRTETLLRKSGIAPWILYKLDNGLDHILLDEAQDTSDAQWNIVQSLTEEFYAGAGAQGNKNRTLFVVGDEKQSIFSFQNADPEAFLSLRAIFACRLKDADKRLETIPLRKSFRSAPAVLKAVDEIFKNDSARQGVSPDPIEHFSAPSGDGSEKIGRIEVWPLLEQDREKQGGGGAWIMPTTCEDERDPQAELAKQIASKIKGWLARREILPGEKRPVAAGDIMILLRRRGRFADLMVRALKAQKVPVTGVDRMRLVDQLSVMDLLAMLRFVLLPEDDLNLASLLRSPLLGVSEEHLMTLAVGREGSLWNSLKAAPEFKIECDYLSAKLNEADFSTPFVFLSRVLNAPCPANADSARKALWARLGFESLDPIEELLNKAQSFGQSHSPSLQNFLHWLTRSELEIKRELDAGNQEQGGGQVRIMTVHASKGLEAPIVFLPDTTSAPRATDKFQWGENDTPLFLAHEPKFGAAHRAWETAREKQMQEYRRLFYVALTRASRRLYICGWQNGKNEGDIGKTWYGLASTALRPLHQEHLLESAGVPAPEIAFADAAIFPAPLPQTKPDAAKETPLPAWIFKRAKEPPVAVSSAPSSETDASSSTPDAAFARGRIIHRLLQSLPELPPDKRAGAVTRFLDRPQHGLTQSQRDEIANEVCRLLSDERFAALFAENSLAEVPLTGSLGGINVLRQVDRLCVRGDEVWIVDYKTNRPPPDREEDIPAPYRRQLEDYRALLRGVYADKKVRCFLLWTYAPALMEVTF